MVEAAPSACRNPSLGVSPGRENARLRLSDLLLRLRLLLRSFRQRLYILTRQNMGHGWHVGYLAEFGIGHNDAVVIQQQAGGSVEFDA